MEANAGRALRDPEFDCWPSEHDFCHLATLSKFLARTSWHNDCLHMYWQQINIWTWKPLFDCSFSNTNSPSFGALAQATNIPSFGGLAQQSNIPSFGSLVQQSNTFGSQAQPGQIFGGGQQQQPSFGGFAASGAYRINYCQILKTVCSFFLPQIETISDAPWCEIEIVALHFSTTLLFGLQDSNRQQHLDLDLDRHHSEFYWFGK